MSRFHHLSLATLAMTVAFLPIAVPDAHADEIQSKMDQTTRSILDSLRVNDTSLTGPVREQATNIAAGTSEVIALPVGGARTLTVAGTFDHAVVVVPEIADVIVMSPGRVQVIARKSGTTDLVLTGPDNQIYKAHIVVSANAAPVQAALSSALPGEHIVATAANGAIMLSGSTHDATTASTAMNIARRFVADPIADVVNNIQVMGVQQVMLRVRVAEVNRSVEKQLGLNTSVSNASGSIVAGSNPGLAAFGQGAAVSTTNTTGGVNSVLGLATATNPVAFVSTKALGAVFTTAASALETEGLVRILAEPNLVTQSGKTASMLAGAQYPVPSISQSGRTGTEYHNFGVSLAFTPTVSSPTSISLDIATEVSTKAENVTFPDGAGGTFQVPVFNTRKANSLVELPSGGSIVIAGLVQSDFQNTLSGIPGLKDIPILGKLFSSADFQRDETELVISVTAYLVEPTDSVRISDPTSGMTPPTDQDLYLFNRLTGETHKGLATPPLGINHDFGYITE